jgi:hypothetical protein
MKIQRRDVLALGGALLVSMEAARAADSGGANAPEAEWVTLFNGKNLDGWMLRSPEAKNGWSVKDGILTTTGGGSDLVSVMKMTNHKLHVEWRIPAGSNSGVYVQGRYEVQIDDAKGKEPEEHIAGSVYGKLKGTTNPAKAAGEWQTFDITFRQPRFDRERKLTRKARITVVFNDVTIIDNQEFEGVTGDALENQEGVAGNLMLQGTHGSAEFRNIRYQPIRGGGNGTRGNRQTTEN